MDLRRKNYTCKRCGYVRENLWFLVEKRGHLYCTECMKDPEISRAQARM